MPLPPFRNTNPTPNPAAFPHKNPDTETVPALKPTSTPRLITIQISSRTQKKLDSLKHTPDESYDTIISRLCDRLTDDEPLSEETLKTIEKSLEELRTGIFYTHEEIVQELIEKTDTCEPEEESIGKIREIQNGRLIPAADFDRHVEMDE